MIFDRALGIDLGTTNSEAAWLPPDERELVLYKDRLGRRTFASAVAMGDNGEWITGHAARAKRATALPPIESAKRAMGQKVKLRCGPHELTPEEVSAKILRGLVDAFAGTPQVEGHRVALRRAVITVPAYFDAPQVEATRAAGERAGLSVIGILQEPTAAAIYQTWKHPELSGNKTFLVYDLGGGTFDVSILRCVENEYQVVALDGDNFLGGDDFDRAFAEHLRKRFVEAGFALDLAPTTSTEDRVRYLKLVHLSQEIKESLTLSEVVSVTKSELLVDQAGVSIPFEAEIHRAEYEAVVAPLVERTLACCERALAEAFEGAGLRREELDHVLLVGGSTRVPLVYRRVVEALCNTTKAKLPPLQEDVDTCVALGAAVHAASLGGLLCTTDDGAASIHFRTPLVGKTASLPLRATLPTAPNAAKTLAVWRDEEFLGEAPLGPKDEALTLSLTLPEEPLTWATFALQNAMSVPVAELLIPLHRGDLRPRPSALTRSAVLSKDLGVEVVRAGRRDRRVVLAKGVGLPAQSTALFFTADQSGTVVLRLLQNRLPIKTLIVQIPKTLPVGTPVELTIHCDESMRIQARAQIEDLRIQAEVDPPEVQMSDFQKQVDGLLEEAENAGRGLWGSAGQAYGSRANFLMGQIRDAARTDLDRLPHLVAHLRDLIDEFKGGTGDTLSPPLEKYEERMGRLKRIAYRVSGTVAGLRRDEWERRVESLDERARVAFETTNGRDWRSINNEVQALLETATQEEWSQVDVHDLDYLKRRLMAGLTLRTALLHQVLAFETREADERGSAQREEAERIGAQLEASVTMPLELLRADLDGEKAGDRSVRENALRKLVAIEEELARLDTALERLPQLGLVTCLAGQDPRRGAAAKGGPPNADGSTPGGT